MAAYGYGLPMATDYFWLGMALATGGGRRRKASDIVVAA